MIASLSSAVSSVSTVTNRSVAGFEIGTVAWITRNGVTTYCVGPSCTWHDDPQVEQELTLPLEVQGGVGRYSCERGDATDPLPRDSSTLVRVETAVFRQIVEKVGGQYCRRDVR